MKKDKNHLGVKIKRLRSFKGMTQDDLANAIGKTRSLVSYLENSGNINKYTLQEISSVLGVSIEELEAIQTEENGVNNTAEAAFVYTSSSTIHLVVEQQKAEIAFLKETINKQWHLLNELSKGKERGNRQ